MGAPLRKPQDEFTLTNSGPVEIKSAGYDIKLYHSQREETDQYETAGFKLRFFATVIDGFLMTSITRLLSFLLKGVVTYITARSPRGAEFFSITIDLLLIFYVYAFPISEWGCTLGKKVMGLKVMNTKSHYDISLSQAFYREAFAKGISVLILGYGFILVALRKDHLALHDMIAKTRVIKYREPES